MMEAKSSKRVGKYELSRTLGEGTFGKVKYAINTETGEAVAIKVLDKEKIQKQNMGNQLKKEISIMKMVRHRYVVGMKEVLASKTKIFIVLELVTGGELFDKIVSVGKLPEDSAKYYFAQLVEGVEYCHSLGVCHRDLKPENLLLDDHGNIKISDFGLSSLYVGDADAGSASRTELLHTTCGTPNYVAPEVLADQGYDGKKADVWSLGVILYVLLAGFLPFDESTIVALFDKIQKAEYSYPSWFSPEVREVLDRILIVDPKKRITLKELKVHPWLQPAMLAIQKDPSSSTVPPLDLSQGVLSSEGSANAIKDEHHEDDLSDGEDSGVDGAPVSLDAFDLVAQCGGFMMNRWGWRGYTLPSSLMNLRHRLYTPLSAENERKKGGRYSFTSSTAPKALFEAVVAALNERGYTIVTKLPTKMLVKATLLTPKVNISQCNKSSGNICLGRH